VGGAWGWCDPQVDRETTFRDLCRERFRADVMRNIGDMNPTSKFTIRKFGREWSANLWRHWVDGAGDDLGNHAGWIPPA